MSPVLSWARQADRLAFVYYSGQRTSVYSITDPRKLKGAPYTAPSAADSALVNFAAARIEPVPGGELLPRQVTPVLTDPEPVLDSTAGDTTTARPEVLGGGSIYRTSRGFRAAGEINPSVDSVAPEHRPLDIEALLDSEQLEHYEGRVYTVELRLSRRLLVFRISLKVSVFVQFR